MLRTLAAPAATPRSAARAAVSLAFLAGLACGAARAEPTLVIVAEGARQEIGLAALDRLAQREATTTTPWTDGPQRFAGVAGEAIAAFAPSGAVEAVVTALNDYVAVVPLAHFIEGLAFIATRRNGEPMRIREKGPFWVMYDFDAMSDEERLVCEPLAVWQVATIQFR